MQQETGREKSWTQWFEIPVSDFKRAKKFYESVFDTEIFVNDFGPLIMGIFPHKTTGCAICKGEHYKPGAQGPVVYIDANPDLQVFQNRIEKAGGKVLMPKKQIYGRARLNVSFPRFGRKQACLALGQLRTGVLTGYKLFVGVCS